MTAKWQIVEPSVAMLEVEVGPEQVSEALDRAFAKVSKRVNVPGFRKGRVPRKIFEARFGVEALYQDALDILLPQAYSEAVTECKIDPVERPSIDVQQMEAGMPLRFTAKVTVKPEVTLPDYSTVPYEAKSFDVTDKDIEEELERLQKGHAELDIVTDGVAQIGDLVVIDFKGTVDGEPFEGGEAENYQLELGTGTFVGGFEDQLVGAAVGEDRTVTVTFPDTYHVKSLAGKQAVFAVRVQDIKRRTYPELDDDFARDISEFETFAELKGDLVTHLKERRAVEAENYARDAVLEKVVEGATVEIPQVMIEQETDVMLAEFGQRLEQQGVPLDAYQEFTGATTEELRAQFRDDATKRVKVGLVLDAVAQAEGIEVTGEELDLELQKLADSAQVPFDRVKALLSQRDPGFAGMRRDLRVRKTVERLAEHGVAAQDGVN
jgi:trigger factor